MVPWHPPCALVRLIFSSLILRPIVLFFDPAPLRLSAPLAVSQLALLSFSTYWCAVVKVHRAAGLCPDPSPDKASMIPHICFRVMLFYLIPSISLRCGVSQIFSCFPAPENDTEQRILKKFNCSLALSAFRYLP